MEHRSGSTHLNGMAVAIWTSLLPTTNSPGHNKYSTSMPIATASLLIHTDELVTRYYQKAGKKNNNKNTRKGEGLRKEWQITTY